MSKVRLDVLVAERGLTESREQAQRLILAGEVIVAGTVASKPGHRFDEGVVIELKAQPRFVGRGGDKLEAAFAAFKLNVEGTVCLDVGSSTGGFTDCLLQHGASHVFAVDVGKGQLHWKLRNDARVTVMEKTNARYLKKGDLSQEPGFAAVDLSFISLTKVLPAVIQVLAPHAEIVTLVKPQFEARRQQVEKGGVVRDPAVRIEVADRIRGFGTDEMALQWLGSLDSPVRGPAGNVEMLVHWRKSA